MASDSDVQRAYHGEAEALRNIGPPLPVVESYASFLATVITCENTSFLRCDECII